VSGGLSQSGLNLRRAYALERIQIWNGAEPRDRSGEDFRLVEATPPPLPPVKRNGNYGVEFLLSHQIRQITRQMPPKRFHAGVFVLVDQIAQGAFVKTKTGGPVEAAKARPARRTQSPLIQRESVREWSLT